MSDSTWNYRAIVIEDDEFGIENWGIHEVYYDRRGKIEGWSKSPIPAGGEGKLELLDDLARMAAAAAQSALRWDVNADLLTDYKTGKVEWEPRERLER